MACIGIGGCFFVTESHGLILCFMVKGGYLLLPAVAQKIRLPRLFISGRLFRDQCPESKKQGSPYGNKQGYFSSP